MNKTGPVILIADDDRSHRTMLRILLEEDGYAVLEAANGREAAQRCARQPAPSLCLLDIRMPGMDGTEALKIIKRQSPEMPVIMMTAFSEVSQAVEAIRLGAYDYLVKPLDTEKLKITLRNALVQANLAEENRSLIEELKSDKKEILGNSPAMAKTIELIRAVGPTEATVLITGESGTGKELAARQVHNASKRAKGPFVAVNCGAFSESLLASELFGHEKGAFTGADRERPGLFMEAQGGTLFLDEIGETPPAMQVKLLRVLQEREVLSVGGRKPRPVDCRIIAATNRDLQHEVEKGTFREDLFYRLNVVNLHMPSLRERAEDIPVLAMTLAKRFAATYNKSFKGILAEAEHALTAWHWPGNVRELENTMERAVILMSGEYISLANLPANFQKQQIRKESEQGFRFSIDNPSPTLEEVERAVVKATLERCGNNKSDAAKILGISRKTLYARLGLDGKD